MSTLAILHAPAPAPTIESLRTVLHALYRNWLAVETVHDVRALDRISLSQLVRT